MVTAFVIAPPFLVLLLICLKSSASKRILVFYDISDALLSFLFFAVTASIPFLFGYVLPSGNNVPPAYGALPFIVTTILNIIMLVYHFYVAYLYNRPRKFAVLLSFFCRNWVTSSIVFVSAYIITMTERAFKVDTTFFILIFIGTFFIIYLCVMRLLIYTFKTSELANYIDFPRMKAIGREWSEEINAANIGRRPSRSNTKPSKEF